MVFLAFRSAAYPLALWAVPSIAIGVLGSNPFPNNSVELFMVGWTVLAVLVALLRDPDALPIRFLLAPPVLLSVALAVLMVARLGSSESPAYGGYKLQLFLAENLLFLAAGILVARRRRHFELWVGLLLATTTISALVVLQGLAVDPAKFESVGNRFALYAEATPIGLGRTTAAAMLLGVYLILVGRSSAARLAALAALPVLVTAFVASGSRGPLLGLLVGLVVLLGLSLYDRASRRRLGLVAVAGVGAALLVPQLVPGRNTARVFSILVGGGGGHSLSNGRAEQWSAAWHAFAGAPLGGIGTGSFAARSAEIYPHNIVLEAAAELGIGGLLLVLGVLAFTGVTLSRIWRRAEARDRHRAALVAALAAAAVVNAMVSGDLASNSAVWLAAGLTLGLAGEFAPEAPLEPLRWAGAQLRRHRWTAAALQSGAGGALIQAAGREMLVAVRTEDRQRGAPPEPRPAAPGLGVALEELAALLHGTTALQARVQDEAGLRWVEFQVARAGSHEWEPVARVTRPPFALAFDTKRLADGLYDFRALAADQAGRVEYSRPLRARRVANAPRVISLREPPAGSWIRGGVSLAARVTDGADVVFEVSEDGTTWHALSGHSWDTQRAADGDYVLRAVGADGWGTSTPVRVSVDNTPPQVRLIEPTDGSVASGTVRVVAEADDTGSGVLAVRFHGSHDGSTWQELASLTRPAYAIGLDTSTLADGDYFLRCVARDRAGNDAATPLVRLRVENAGPAERAAEPEPVVRQPDSVATLALDRVTLWDLERLAEEEPGHARSEERRALLYSLRPFTNADGTIPPAFWDLVREAFDEFFT